MILDEFCIFWRQLFVRWWAALLCEMLRITGVALHPHCTEYKRHSQEQLDAFDLIYLAKWQTAKNPADSLAAAVPSLGRTSPELRLSLSEAFGKGFACNSWDLRKWRPPSATSSHPGFPKSSNINCINHYKSLLQVGLCFQSVRHRQIQNHTNFAKVQWEWNLVLFHDLLAEGILPQAAIPTEWSGIMQEGVPSRKLSPVC